MNRHRFLRGTAIAIVATLAVGSLSACGTTAAPDYLLVRYDKGTGGGLKFKECVQPSKKAGTTWNDQNFALPVSLRTWNISLPNQGGDSNDAIQTGTRPQAEVKGSDGKIVTAAQPGPDMKVYTKAEFYLNTDCSGKKDSPIVRFWENTGRRYNVATDGETNFSADGWKNMLLNTLVPAESKAVRAASRNFDADDLDTNTGGVWAQLEAQMATTFVNELNASIGGGDYFCGPQYRRGSDGKPVDVKWSIPDPASPTDPTKAIEQHGTCPPVRISIIDINYADTRISDARASAYAAEQTARAAAIDAQSKVNVANKLKEAGTQGAEVQRQQNQLQLEQERTKQVEKCAANPNCTIILGAGAGVTVGTGK
jgi:hypothetical protein